MGNVNDPPCLETPSRAEKLGGAGRHRFELAWEYAIVDGGCEVDDLDGQSREKRKLAVKAAIRRNAVECFVLAPCLHGQSMRRRCVYF